MSVKTFSLVVEAVLGQQPKGYFPTNNKLGKFQGTVELTEEEESRCSRIGMLEHQCLPRDSSGMAASLYAWPRGVCSYQKPLHTSE